MATASQKITEMRFLVLIRGALTPIKKTTLMSERGSLTSLTSSHYADPNCVNADSGPDNAQGHGQTDT